MFGDLIGRDHAAGVLRAELDRSTSRHGGLVLVAGEAGIGKTALVTGAAEEARTRGALVLGGSCWDAENAPGYWPWVQVLRALRRAVGVDEWAEIAEAAGPTLGVLLGARPGEAARPQADPGPAIASNPSAAASPEAAPEGFEVFDAVTSALVTASHRRPLVVVFEDLHWADTASLRLLRFAAQHTWFERLLLLCTYRDAEVEPPDHPLHALMMPLVAKATTLALAGLTRDEVGALIARTVGDAPGPALLAEVYRRTGGNPFFVEQTARLWASGGGVTAIPPGVGDVVRRRLALLPARVMRLLTDAAVLGREFHRQVLSAVAAVPAAETDRLLDHAVTARLVVQRGGGRFAFAHDLVRETLYAGLDEGERRRRHAAVVTALDPAALADRVPPADLARHARLAGAELTPARAVDLLRSAGEDAVGRMAFEEGTAHYRDAYALSAALGARRRVLVGLEYALELHHGRSSREAAAVMREAAEVARRLDDPALLTRVALTLHRSYDPVRADGLGPLRADLLREAHARLIGRNAPADDGERDGGRGELDRIARELAVRIAVLARRGEDDDALAFSLWARHDAIWGPGTAGERLALIEEMIAVGRRSGDLDMEHYAASLRWVTLVELGDPAYLAALGDYVTLVEASRQPRFWMSASIDQSITAVFQGRFEDGEAHWSRAVEITALGDPTDHYAQFASALTWQKHLLQGRFDELDEPLEESAGGTFPNSHLELFEGVAAAQRGDVDEVERVWATARSRRYPGFVESVWLRFQAQAAALSRDPERCAAAKAALGPSDGEWLVSMFGFDISGPVALWAGLLDAAVERWDAAVASLRAAAESADVMRSRPWAAEARAHLADALIGRGGPGDDEAALAALDAVEREAAELGLRHLPARVAASRARLTGAPRARASAAEFRFDGSVWTLTYAGRTVHMPDAKGLRDLHELLAHPGGDIPAVRLLAPEAGAVERLGGDPVLDDEAKARYRAHLTALDAEIDRATERGDDPRAAELDRERAALLDELRTAAGLGGRSRRLGDEAERARKTVTARIRDTLRRLDDRHPELATHLRATVTTGTMCAYRPAPDEQPFTR
ncbi:ATP-binding protein [Streptomyces radicis]|uniref:ATPase n=1 Tax=Streptomyces radicis TaxID=1750517 RepID=A0A3A9WEG9_9ACTN|nr:AAA family ATPase [Streptomyces radicis]RKN11405.1 ATPase [Streptomyces radicis]RKN26576.1 ATPase [Streptomyces radicis]